MRTASKPEAVGGRQRRPARIPTHAPWILALAAVALATPGTADAGLVIRVRDSVAAPGTTGSLDVVLQEVGGTDTVSGFSVGLGLDPASGLRFVGADTNTVAAPYLFGSFQLGTFEPGARFAYDADDPDRPDPFPTANLFVFDNVQDSRTQSITLRDGDVFGLAHLSYSVPADLAPGSYRVSVEQDLTSLSDPAGNPIEFTSIDGTVSIQTVPEPSSITLSLVGVIGTLYQCWRRKRTAPGWIRRHPARRSPGPGRGPHFPGFRESWRRPGPRPAPRPPGYPGLR